MKQKEYYDYYVVQQKVDGFGNDTWTVYSAKTESECWDFLKTYEFRNSSCQVVGQWFGKEFRNIYE